MAPHHPTRFIGSRIALLGFLVLTGAFGLNFAAGQFFAPLGQAQGWSVGAISVAAAINTAVGGVVQPAMGRLLDRHGPRFVMTGSLALMGGSYVLMSRADEFWHVVVAYGVMGGVGFAGSSSLAVTVLISRWYERRRADVLLRVFLGINAGQLTLVPLGGLLIEQAGYRSAYALLGLLVLALLVPLVARFVVDAPERVNQRPDGTRSAVSRIPRGASVGAALRSRSFWLATLAFGANGWTLYFTLLHLPRLARDAGAGVATGGQLVAVAAATSAVTMLAIRPLVRRAGKRRTAAGLFALRAVVLAAAAAVATDAAQLFVVAAAFGVSGFPVIPLMMGLITERFGTHVLGGVLGVVFVSHQLFAGIGVLVGGLLRDRAGGYDAALLAGVAVLLAGIALLVALEEPAGARSRQDLVPPDRTHPTPILEGGTP